MSSSLPVTGAEIAEAAVGAANAGAAIVHLHARNPVDGRPDQTPEAFGNFLKEIKRRSNVVVNLTTGGSPYMKVEERILPAKVFAPEIASLNMGSMNFGLFPMLKRFKEFRHEWERSMLENSRDLVFRNTYKDIEYALGMLNQTETRYEFECYDTSHLYNLRYFLDEKLVKPPLFVQTVFGILGGIGPHPEDVLHMKRTADRLFGSDYRWSVLGAGRGLSPRWQPPWVATSVSDSRIHSGYLRAKWPSRMRNRSAKYARSLRVWASRSPRPMMRGAFSN
jgi:uncharacterized protein (DUF849 family)